MIDKFYVYRHLRNDTGEPFNVGKGSGNRAWSTYYRNPYWCNIVNKVGYTTEIIMENLSELQAFEKEIEFIKMYKDLGYCEANFTAGGEGPSGHKHSEETKKMMSTSRKGEKNSFYGKRHSEAYKKLISRHNKGRNLGGSNPAARKVIDMDTGNIFNCMKDAASANNITVLTVYRHCRDIMKTPRFKYYNGGVV